MSDYQWPADLDGDVAAPLFFDRPLKEIYNRYTSNPASVLHHIVNFLFEEKDATIVLKPMEHVCYLWKVNEDGEVDEAGYLIDVKFHDSGLLLELIVSSETVPLEPMNLFGKDIMVPVFRKDEPLPEHPAALWFMEIVRQLEAPPLLEVHGLLSQEIAREYIWGVCEEIVHSLETIARVQGNAFPQSVSALEASLERLEKRFKKMAASTGITRLNIQADMVCLAAQIFVQTSEPEDEVQMRWMKLLGCLSLSEVFTAILAARAKVAFLEAHPEFAQLPNDTGLSLDGPMRMVGLAIREAIRRGVYK